MGTNRGSNQKSYACFEELTHLRVSPDAEVPYLYKRLDKQTHLPVEERSYQLRIPVPNHKGLRKSLRTPDRTSAVEKSEEEVLNLRVLLRQGGSATPVPVEEMVQKFLRMKKSLIRDKWEGKEDAGRKSITRERYGLIEGKLRNYLVRFLGAKTDVRTIPHQKWSEWRTWRIENDRKGGKPKADTIQNEMGNIRSAGNGGWRTRLSPSHPNSLSTMRTSSITTRRDGIRGNHTSGTLSQERCVSG